MMVEIYSFNIADEIPVPLIAILKTQYGAVVEKLKEFRW